MKKMFFAAFAAVSLSSAATQYSCLSIITEAKRLGKWQALKSWIRAADLEDEWGKASYVSDSYPQFPAITNMLVSSGVLTQSDVVSIMTNSVDTAVPDASLRRVYSRDVSNSSGRSKWHGKLVTQVVDTNAWTKTSVYEDGTRFVDRASAPPPKRDPVYNPVVAKTNGVPVRLAEARKRWASVRNSGGVTNVTVILKAGE